MAEKTVKKVDFPLAHKFLQPAFSRDLDGNRTEANLAVLINIKVGCFKKRGGKRTGSSVFSAYTASEFRDAFQIMGGTKVPQVLKHWKGTL
jgi:hypothetical protein